MRAIKLRFVLAGLAWTLALAIVGPATGQSPERAAAGGSTYKGVEVSTDLPMGLRVKNTVGIDGQGLCVWAASQMMANYLNVIELFDLFEEMKKQKGGGWPERVDSVMKAMAPNRLYLQHIGTDLDFIQEGIDSGRPVCMTYGYGEIYGGTISHMVICVHLDDKYGAVIDDNEPNVVRWMGRAELQRRFVHTNGYGWAWYILASPPPPVPHN